MKKQLIIVLMMQVVLLSGCTSARSVYMNAALIDYSYGINIQDTKYIAQKYCLDAGMKDVFISFPEVQGYFFKPELWEVIFRIKNLSQLDYHYRLLIDMKTGDVEYVAYEE
jgi:uncharacterized protein YceK